MQNGNGNGKRWLLIGLIVLGGFWLVNDSYRDGYTDALIQTGQVTNVRQFRGGGPHFPWHLVILGGIGYIAWRKGAFDRFGGPGGPFAGDHGHGNGERGIQQYGAGSTPAQAPGSAASRQGFGSGFRGPRAFFDEWHRQAHEAHEAARSHFGVPPAPPVPPAPQTGARAGESGNGSQQGGYAPTPPPPPPAPDYWASMARAAEAAGNPGAPSAPVAQPPAAPEARQDEQPDGPRGAAGPALERW